MSKHDLPDLEALEAQLLPALDKKLAALPTLTQAKGHLLIAEDSRIKAKQLEYFFRKAGYSVTPVRDGLEAVQVFEATKKPFDAVLLNLVMPRLHGFKTTKYLRQKLHYTGPIIGFSVTCYEEQRAEAKAVGMNACVDYFLNYEQLRLAVDQLVGARREAKKNKV